MVVAATPNVSNTCGGSVTAGAGAAAGSGAGAGFAAFVLVAGRMAVMAASDPYEPRAHASGSEIIAQRADIVDRNGRILATNLTTHALYAQPPLMVDPERAATELARIFPDLDGERLLRDFTGERKFLWIKRKISPEQMQAVHDIGEPGLLFGPREMRLYPNGAVASHVLGGTRFGEEGVNAAQVVGVAGVEMRETRVAGSRVAKCWGPTTCKRVVQPPCRTAAVEL